MVVVPALAGTSYGVRPPLWVLMALAGFGAIALVGTAPGLGAPVPTVEARVSGLAGTVAVAVCTSTLTRAWIAPAEPGHSEYYGPTIARVGAVVVAAVVAVAVIAAFHLARGRPAHDRLWAAAVLGLPAGWLGPFDLLTPSLASSAPHFGRLAQVLFATCVAVAVMHRLARRRRTGGDRRSAPRARAGWHALGTAAGLSAWIVLAYLGVAGPRPESGAGAPRLRAGHARDARGARARRRDRRTSPAGRRAAGSSCSPRPGRASSARGSSPPTSTTGRCGTGSNFGHTAAVATAVVLVPLWECAVAAARVRRDAAAAVRADGAGRRPPCSSPRSRWLAVLTVQYLPGWAPPLLGAAACVVASSLARRPIVRNLGRPLRP